MTLSSHNTLLMLCISLCCVGCDSGQAPGNPKAPVSNPQSGTLNPSIGMKFIKPGQFVRLTSRSQLVSITQGFWIGVHEITQKKYESVMSANPSFFKGPDLPVEKVSFLQALDFCRTLTAQDRKAGRISADMAYRLPTEAEWEYACLATAATAFSFGETEESVEEYAWTAETADDRTQPVGLKKPNAWGLHDMHGNVWEWVVDWFAPHPKAEQLVDPTGPPEGKHRVFKGGGWYHEAKFSQSTTRFMMDPGVSINYVGLRLVLAKRGEATR